MLLKSQCGLTNSNWVAYSFAHENLIICSFHQVGIIKEKCILCCDKQLMDYTSRMQAWFKMYVLCTGLSLT